MSSVRFCKRKRLVLLFTSKGLFPFTNFLLYHCCKWTPLVFFPCALISSAYNVPLSYWRIPTSNLLFVLFSLTMKTLWTPWRLEHVLGNAPKTNGCIFEPDGQDSANKKLLLLYRDALVIVLLNRFPYSNGHLLVAPARHVPCITELSQQESTAVINMIKKATSLLTKHLSPRWL